MRKLIFILLGLLLAVPLTAQKKAILIGVSDYPEGSGWCKLNAHNDVTLLRDLLSSDWDVTVLEDRQATHNGIVSILEKAATSISLGDTVFIHFSGHGQQMLPMEADYLHDPDMLDEAIIPFDAKKDWAPNYTGQNHIRDNEFGRLIDAIRNKTGVNGLVFVILDACHSDSMERDAEENEDKNRIYRGTSDIFGQKITDEDLKKRFKRDTSRIVMNNNSAVIYISACQAYSRNAEIITPEGVGYGSLSYAVAIALKESGVKDLNAFLDRVVTAMDSLVRYQTPEIRTTFDYQYPTTKVETPTKSVVDNEESHSKGYILAVAVSLVLLLIFIWRAKRK